MDTDATGAQQQPDDAAQMDFDFIDVFRKDRHGTWLFSSIVFNSKDAPA